MNIRDNIRRYYIRISIINTQTNNNGAERLLFVALHSLFVFKCVRLDSIILSVDIVFSS